MIEQNKMTVEKSRIDIRVLAAISLFASKDENRYYLNGVCVEIDPRSVTYVATDGHRLVAYRDALFDENNANTSLGTFIIPTEQCRAFKCKKKDDISAAVLTQDIKTLTLEFDGVGLTFSPIDGTFPGWRATVPASACGQLAQFNFSLLADFRRFADALQLTPPFISHNGEAPASVHFCGFDHIVAVIMPMRIDGPPAEFVMPAWALPVERAEAA